MSQKFFWSSRFPMVFLSQIPVESFDSGSDPVCINLQFALFWDQNHVWWHRIKKQQEAILVANLETKKKQTRIHEKVLTSKVWDDITICLSDCCHDAPSAAANNSRNHWDITTICLSNCYHDAPSATLETILSTTIRLFLSRRGSIYSCDLTVSMRQSRALNQNRWPRWCVL